MKTKSVLMTILILILCSNGYSGWYLNYSYNILKPTVPFNQLQITFGDFTKDQKVLWNFYLGQYSSLFGIEFLPHYTIPLLNNNLNGNFGLGVSINYASGNYGQPDSIVHVSFRYAGIAAEIGCSKSLNNFDFKLNFRPAYNFNLDVTARDTSHESLLKELKRDLFDASIELGASYRFKRVTFGASYQFDYIRYFPENNWPNYDHILNMVRISVGVLLGKIKN
jgi:hypothetical protein